MKLTELLESITPLPYRVQGRFIGSESRTVANCDISSIRPSAREVGATAAYLTHAANVLPELVAAIKKYGKAQSVYGTTGKSYDADLLQIAGDELQSALARAGEVKCL